MRLPLKYMLMCLLPLIQQVAEAQLSKGGKPITSGTLKSSFQWINLDDVVVEDLLLEDQEDALRGIKNRRIAREIPVSLNPEMNGTWDWDLTVPEYGDLVSGGKEPGPWELFSIGICSKRVPGFFCMIL